MPGHVVASRVFITPLRPLIAGTPWSLYLQLPLCAAIRLRGAHVPTARSIASLEFATVLPVLSIFIILDIRQCHRYERATQFVGAHIIAANANIALAKFDACSWRIPCG